MAKKNAARRHAKELRRKAALVERRKTEAVTNSLAARVARASRLPIQYCMVSAGLFGVGIGSLSLARGPTKGNVTWSMFLLDVHCLGIKDAFVRELVGPEVDEHLNYVEMSTPVAEISPPDARKLLHDLAAWSHALGFQPHKDYALAEALFGDVDATTSTATFQFGFDGKPHYVPGPGETPAKIRRDIASLTATVGTDGFDSVSPLAGTDWDSADDYDLEIEDDSSDNALLTIDGVVEPEQPVIAEERRS